MYAVVYKDKVIVGPMVWNRGIFEGSLERKDIKTSLPRVAPEQLPFVINEDAKIMLVEENRPEMNPMVEYYYGPLWDVSGEKAIANYEVHDSPIAFAQVNFRQQAADERWKKEIVGTKINIQNTEVTIDTSRDGRNIFVQKYSLMADNETVNWKFPEGWLTLTKAELGQIVNAGAAHIQSAFDWEKTINEQIDAATTKEELLAIEIVEKPVEPSREELPE
jgi:hypothetical protein